MAKASVHEAEKLTRYAYGELDTVERNAVREHLARCAKCEEYVSFITRFNAALRDTRSESVGQTEAIECRFGNDVRLVVREPVEQAPLLLHNGKVEVVAIPRSKLVASAAKETPIEVEGLPFDVQVVKYFQNSTLRRAKSSDKL